MTDHYYNAEFADDKPELTVKEREAYALKQLAELRQIVAKLEKAVRGSEKATR